MDATEEIKICIYRSEDGIARQRCQEHIPETGPYRPIRHNAMIGSFFGDRRRCPACYAEMLVAETQRTGSTTPVR